MALSTPLPAGRQLLHIPGSFFAYHPASTLCHAALPCAVLPDVVTHIAKLLLSLPSSQPLQSPSCKLEYTPCCPSFSPHSKLSQQEACGTPSQQEICSNQVQQQAWSALSEEQTCSKLSQQQGCSTLSPQQACRKLSEQKACNNQLDRPQTTAPPMTAASWHCPHGSCKPQYCSTAHVQSWGKHSTTQLGSEQYRSIQSRAARSGQLHTDCAPHYWVPRHAYSSTSSSQPPADGDALLDQAGLMGTCAFTTHPAASQSLLPATWQSAYWATQLRCSYSTSVRHGHEEPVSGGSNPTGEAAQQLQQELARCHVAVPAATAVGLAFAQGQLPLEVDLLVERVESLRGQLGEMSGDELMKNRPRVLVKPMEGMRDKVETLAVAMRMPVQQVRNVVSRHPAWLSLSPSIAASRLSALSVFLSLPAGPRLHRLLYDAPSLLTRELDSVTHQAARMCSLLEMSKDQFLSVAIRCPRILLVEPDTAQSNLDKLAQTLQVERHEVARLVPRFPDLLRHNAEKLAANMIALKEQTGWQHEEVVSVVMKQPCLLAFQPECLVERLDMLGPVLQIEHTQLLAAMVRDSRILSFTPATLGVKLKVWQEILGGSAADVAEVCLTTAAFTLSAASVQSKWKQLCELAQSSTAWQRQLTKLQPNSKVRCMQAGAAKFQFLQWLVKEGMQDKISLYAALLAGTDTVSKRFPAFKAKA